MKVWEALNILESLDPKSEVTLVLSKSEVSPEPKLAKEAVSGKYYTKYNKTYVIGKEGWPSTPAYPAWHHNITCHGTPH